MIRLRHFLSVMRACKENCVTAQLTEQILIVLNSNKFFSLLIFSSYFRFACEGYVLKGL